MEASGPRSRPLTTGPRFCCWLLGLAYGKHSERWRMSSFFPGGPLSPSTMPLSSRVPDLSAPACCFSLLPPRHTHKHIHPGKAEKTLHTGCSGLVLKSWRSRGAHFPAWYAAQEEAGKQHFTSPTRAARCWLFLPVHIQQALALTEHGLQAASLEHPSQNQQTSSNVTGQTQATPSPSGASLCAACQAHVN